ncbi:hypothetical protein B0H13DRAFT_2422875 [Mycena leptocephala]|nr:hypothetical protein B0H13DRAFT_2422875 [Mycena leptocephala]
MELVVNLDAARADALRWGYFTNYWGLDGLRMIWSPGDLVMHKTDNCGNIAKTDAIKEVVVGSMRGELIGMQVFRVPLGGSESGGTVHGPGFNISAAGRRGTSTGHGNDDGRGQEARLARPSPLKSASRSRALLLQRALRAQIPINSNEIKSCDSAKSIFQNMPIYFIAEHQDRCGHLSNTDPYLVPRSHCTSSSNECLISEGGMKSVSPPSDQTLSVSAFNVIAKLGSFSRQSLHFDGSSSRAWTPLAELRRGRREVGPGASPNLGESAEAPGPTSRRPRQSTANVGPEPVKMHSVEKKFL